MDGGSVGPTWTSECGTVQLYLGDCMDVLPTLAPGSVDAVVTDPPYGVGFKYATHDDSRENYESWCAKWFELASRVSQCVFMSCGAVNVAMWARICPFRWQVAWLKPAAMGRSPVGFCNWEPMLLWGKPGTSSSVDVFTAPIAPDVALSGHPCPKPIKWGEKSVGCVTETGDLVLDMFLGSGTTGVAAVRLGRRFIGVEIDPGYFEIAKRRIQDELRRVEFLEPKRAVERQASLFGDGER